MQIRLTHCSELTVVAFALSQQQLSHVRIHTSWPCRAGEQCSTTETTAARPKSEGAWHLNKGRHNATVEAGNAAFLIEVLHCPEHRASMSVLKIDGCAHPHEREHLDDHRHHPRDACVHSLF
jgi:hypothetical protein